MSRSGTSLRICAALGTCAAICVLALSLEPAQAHRPPQPVTTMSYNIFQGSELSHSLTAKTLPQLAVAVAADYRNVLGSKIPARAKALAREIEANQPAVVGLQEAVLWRIRSPAGPQPFAIPGNATQVSFDFVNLLVRALVARGAHYRAVATTNNFDVQATGDFAGGKKMDVRITDRVAILARKGVTVSNVQEHNFVARDTFKLLGFPIPVPDGWASVDAKLKGRRFRFITAHLDGLNDSNSKSIRAAEANEILLGPAANTNMPVAFTCDCNSKPTTPTHHELAAGGFHDSWLKLHPHAAGLTCCHRRHRHDNEPDIVDPHPHQGIIERIDYIWARSPFTIKAVSLLGLNPSDRTRTKPKLWPSDHLGLVAQLAVP